MTSTKPKAPRAMGPQRESENTLLSEATPNLATIYMYILLLISKVARLTVESLSGESSDSTWGTAVCGAL